LVYSLSSFAKWETIVDSKVKVFKNSKYKSTYITRSNSGFFTGNKKHKEGLLKLFNIYDWSVTKETPTYIIGEYFDGKGKINYFLESKKGKSVHITTKNKLLRSRLHAILVEFKKENTSE
jgi:hypothetical protein